MQPLHETRRLVCCVLAALAPLAAGAQDVPRSAGADSARVQSCAGETVASIELVGRPPLLASDRVPGWARGFLRLLLQHRQTRAEAIEPFLLIEEGQSCTADDLADTRRMLRAQPYLADAEVFALRDESGALRVIVETEDEIPLIIGGGIRGGKPSSIRYGNGNVMGYGAAAVGSWRDGLAYRDEFGVELAHYHVAGRNRGRLDLIRGVHHERYVASLTRPYFVEAQRMSWHLGGGRSEEYIGYLRASEPTLSQAVERDHAEAGAVWRLGRRGRRLVGGIMATHERVALASRGVVIAEHGLVEDADVPGARDPWHTTRAGALFGGRWLRWHPLVGLDSSSGTIDVASGVQAITTVGHGIAGDFRDPFVAFDFYGALGSSTRHFSVVGSAEGRAVGSGDWEGVVASVQTGWYEKPSNRRTRVVNLEFGSSWDALLPQQLSLADRRGGLRGYHGSREAGGRRAVLRYEERLSVGGMGPLAGFGVAAFTDVGKLWAGDAPFGTTSGLRASLGAGVLLAVPRRSQRLIRLDVATPLVRDDHTRSVTLHLSMAVPYRAFWREPSDVARMRMRAPTTHLLAWP